MKEEKRDKKAEIIDILLVVTISIFIICVCTIASLSSIHWYNYAQEQKQMIDNFCQIGNNYAEALKITISILEELSEKYNFTDEDKMLIYILEQQEIETINCSEYLE